MNKVPVLYALSALLLAGCASTSNQSSMSAAELSDCLQPNRRVVVEVVGQVAKPPAKKPEAKPGEAEAKPEAKAEAAPAPKKPAMVNIQETLYVQGNTAFDPGAAILKDGGKKEIDAFLAKLQKRAAKVNAVIVAGHTDRIEANGNMRALSEQRAKSVTDYLISHGVSQKAIFWEGKDDKQPVPVTKFCT